MKNKIFPLVLLFSLGGVLAPLQAMPPKPMKGRPTEEKMEEEGGKGYNAEEQRQRSTDAGDEGDWSSAVVRGEGVSEREYLDLSLDKLDEPLAIVQQALQACKGMLNSTVVAALNESALRDKADEAEKKVLYWSDQRKHVENLLSLCLEQRKRKKPIKEDELKLEAILTSCRDLWMQWDDFFSSIQDEIERRNGIFIDEAASDVGSVSGLEKAVASMKLADSLAAAGAGIGKTVAVDSFSSSSRSFLKSRLENFLATPRFSSSLVDMQLSVADKHQENIRDGIQTLLQEYKDEATLKDRFMELLKDEGTKEPKKTKFRDYIKETWEDAARSSYNGAERQYVRGRIAEAVQSYRNTIKKAEEAAHIWSETAIFYTKLRDATGLKVRRLGVRIKERLKQQMRDCQFKLDGINLEQKTNIDRVVQQLNPLQAERAAVLEQARVVEEVAQNEVGTTCRVIAGNLAAMMPHLQAAHHAYAHYDFERGGESERIADEIQRDVKCLKLILNEKLELWNEWRERNFEPECIEGNEQKGVWKTWFMGPLIRREKVIASAPVAAGEEAVPTSATAPEHEVEMAAEYLMVVLQPNQKEEKKFLEGLAARGFPGCTLESVSREQALYRIYFQSNQEFQHPLLETMDALKKTIQENQLAVRCYPDYMMELCGDVHPAAAAPGAGVHAAAMQEPWAFHHEKGLHPPAELFDLQHPLLQCPQHPIKVAIVDTGIYGSIANGSFKTHPALDGKIAYAFDSQRNQATGFGYNACVFYDLDNEDPDYRRGIDLLRMIPEDVHVPGNPESGHGTHVAGIIAASDRTFNPPITVPLNDQNAQVGRVAGLAGMPGFVQLLIYKCNQPGSSKKGFCSRVIECIEHAGKAGAEIINCSLLGYESHDEDDGFTSSQLRGLKNAIEGKSFVLVAAAGNRSQNFNSLQMLEKSKKAKAGLQLARGYPCCFKLLNLISVAATNKQGRVPNGFSNFGTDYVHVAAPGKEIISTENKADSYRFMTGTSQAAPYVAAALALAKIKYPFLTHVQLANYFRYACSGGSGGEMQVGHGPVDITKVLSQEKLVAFLKAQKMTDLGIQVLLNPKKGKK